MMSNATGATIVWQEDNLSRNVQNLGQLISLFLLYEKSHSFMRLRFAIRRTYLSTVYPYLNF